MAGFGKTFSLTTWTSVISGGNKMGDSRGRNTPIENEREKKYGELRSFVWYNVMSMSRVSGSVRSLDSKRS